MSSASNQTLKFDPKSFIQPVPFLLFVGADIAIIIAAFIIWKCIWVSIDRLKIKNIKDDIMYKIGPNSQTWKVISYCRSILRNLLSANNYLTEKCGFQAYTFLYFQRRIALVLSVFCITDLCIWIPYQLFFNPYDSFSLVTMPSTGNQNFRTFYTLWIASTLLYFLHTMHIYLSIQLSYLHYRKPQKKILNNLKAKTLYVNFLGEKFYTQAQVKSQIQQYLVDNMGEQDRIIAVLPIPNRSKHLEMEYRLKIIEIVAQIGIENMSCLWNCFKAKNFQQIEHIKSQTRKDLQDYVEVMKKSQWIEGCFIVVSEMETAQRLCYQFELSKAIYKICPDVFYTDQQILKSQDKKMIVKWAQQPKDIVWINMTVHTKQILNLILFNFFCILLLVLSFAVISLTSATIIPLPKLIAPLILAIVNSTLRFLISKMVEWQNKLFRSQTQTKQFHFLCLYFFINVILGSIFRDTLNLIPVLKSGWGFIQLLKLIYQKIDGYFYYLFIFNQTVISIVDALVKPGQLFPDCYEVALYYQKVTRVKQKSMYGKNDSFRFGYCYAIDFIVLAVVIIYSVSNPLIHLFGLIYFCVRYHLNAYTFAVFHEQEMFSNMRLILKIIQSIGIVIALWVFLVGTSLIFDKYYSNSILLYIFCGFVLYYAAMLAKISALNDQKTENQLRFKDIRLAVKEWKKLYAHPFRQQKYSSVFPSQY